MDEHIEYDVSSGTEEKEPSVEEKLWSLDEMLHGIEGPRTRDLATSFQSNRNKTIDEKYQDEVWRGVGFPSPSWSKLMEAQEMIDPPQ